LKEKQATFSLTSWNKVRRLNESQVFWKDVGNNYLREKEKLSPWITDESLQIT
jgi:hypothetical protein